MRVIIIKKLKNENTLFFKVYIIILSIVLGTIIYGILNITFSNEQKKYMDFSSNWFYETEEVNLNEIYKYSEIKKTIPKLEHDKELFLIVKNAYVNIYIDNEFVYKHEGYNKELFGDTPGTYFIKINMLKEDSGKEITLSIDKNYEYKTGKIKKIYIGEASDFLLDFVFSGLLSIIISSMIFFLGITLIVIFVPLRIKRKISLKIIYLGLFAIAMGTYLISSTKLLQLLSGNDYLYHMISEISMLLISIPIILFLNSTFGKFCKKKSIILICLVSVLNFIICYLLHVLGISNLHETSILTHFTCISCGIYILFICVKVLIKGNSKEKQHALGFICFSLSVLLDIFIFYLGMLEEATLYTKFGVLTFLCIEGSQFAVEYIKKYKKQARTELLSKLAYHDGLTDLLNRTSFMEDMKKLKDTKTGLIAVIDVNNLKQVNDNIGHTEGDELIINVANSLKISLSEIGKCYRIGGDEFVFISTEKDIEDKFKECLSNLLKELQKYNTKDSKFITSIALGYSIINENNCIDQAFEMADSNMYKNKIKIKEKQKKLK